MLTNLRGRVRTWFQLRAPVRRAVVPPPLPVEVLVDMDDIVVTETDPDADLQVWCEAFNIDTEPPTK